MVFKILIAIVFIAELIITATIIILLVKANKRINQTNIFINRAKPEIKSICELIRGLSEQIYELIPDWIEELQNHGKKILLEQAKSIMAGILFWSINIKVLKKIKQTKMYKLASKGLSLLQNVV